jgi:hypothetical protein
MNDLNSEDIGELVLLELYKCLEVSFTKRIGQEITTAILIGIPKYHLMGHGD